MKWLLLILSLPTQNATARMRVWRAIKASGAAVLRDGVYLLPLRTDHFQLMSGIAQDVQSNQGSAYVLTTETEEDTPDPSSQSSQFIPLFDRSADFQGFTVELKLLQQQLAQQPVVDSIKQLRKLRKNFASIVAIDFFPGDMQSKTQDALQSIEKELNQRLSSDEPMEDSGEITQLTIADFQRRRWATRKRPWVDRLACAWLIQRFIDPQATFLWLDSPRDCPADALGFDFDGARFTHTNTLVSYEVLLTSFSLNHPGLKRLATIVHYLDAGGFQPQEASGVEQILWGLRETIHNDDHLLHAAASVFDALFSAFNNKEQS